MFSIEFTDEPLEHPYDDSTIAAAPGLLVMAGRSERFISNLALWDKNDYESHWRRELKSIIDGKNRVAIITCYNDPAHSTEMEIWPAYRDDGMVRMQNHLLSYIDLPQGFAVSEVSSYLEDRQVIDEDGNKLSEWSVTIRDIEEFLKWHEEHGSTRYEP